MNGKVKGAHVHGSTHVGVLCMVIMTHLMCSQNYLRHCVFRAGSFCIVLCLPCLCLCGVDAIHVWPNVCTIAKPIPPLGIRNRSVVVRWFCSNLLALVCGLVMSITFPLIGRIPMAGTILLYVPFGNPHSSISCPKHVTSLGHNIIVRAKNMR